MGKKEIMHFYDEQSKTYTLHMINTGHYRAQEKLLSLLINEIKEPVLDIACGAGFLVNLLSKKYKEVYGNDFSLNMVKSAKQNCSIKITNCDAEKLSTYNKKFNTIFCCNVFYYLPNKDKAIKRWMQLLDKNGKIVFFEENPFINNFNPELKKLLTPLSPTEIEEIMKKHGFYLVSKKDIPIDDKHSLYGLIFSRD